MVDKKKILFVYRIDPFDKKTYGIYQKLKNQIRAWKSFGYDCDTITFDNHKLTFNGNVLRNNTEYPLGSLWNTTLLFLQWITWSNLDFKKYDIVLIRHAPIGWGLKSLIAQIKSTHVDCKLILDLPTYPYLHEYNGIKKLIAKILLPSKLKVDGVTHLGPERIIFGVPVIPVFNTFDTASVKPKDEFHNKKPSIKLIYVASLWELYALEDLINAMKQFNSLNTKRKLHLTIVGEGDKKSELERIISIAGVKNVINLVDAQFDQELYKLINTHDLGIGRIINNIDHKDMTYTQALKHRMYAAFGLPFITNMYDPALSGLDGVYTIDAKKVDLNTLENIYTWYSSKIEIMPKISKNLREFAEKTLNEEINVKNILTFANKL